MPAASHSDAKGYLQDETLRDVTKRWFFYRPRNENGLCILVVVGFFLPSEQQEIPQPFFSVCSGHIAPISEIFVSIQHRQHSFMSRPSLKYFFDCAFTYRAPIVSSVFFLFLNSHSPLSLQADCVVSYSIHP